MVIIQTTCFDLLNLQILPTERIYIPRDFLTTNSEMFP
jgi:hypothetical protein